MSVDRTNAEERDLFRKEVVDARQGTWLGEVQLSRPLSFSVLSAVAIGLALALIIFLWLGEYTKKVTAVGYVTTDKGVVTLIAKSIGTITELKVTDGDTVAKGALLALIDLETNTVRGPLQGESSVQMTAKRRLIAADIAGARATYAREHGAKTNRLQAIRSELQIVKRQIEIQNERLRFADASLTRFQKMKEDGFISELALQDRSKELLAEKNSLELLNRAVNGLEKEDLSVQAEVEQLRSHLEEDIRRMEASLAQLSIDEIQNEGRRQLAVTAPVDGIVSGILVSTGRSIREGQSLLTIVPKDSQTQIDLYVPTKSATSLRPGSAVTLRHRAFPHEKYGVQRGTIIRVSSIAIPSTDLPYPAPPGELYFLVSVRPATLDPPSTTYAVELKPGMVVDGRLELETRRLLMWIFEPIARALYN